MPPGLPGNAQVKLIVASTHDELERALSRFLTRLHGHDVLVTLSPTVTSALAPGSHHLAWVVYLTIDNGRAAQPLPP